MKGKRIIYLILALVGITLFIFRVNFDTTQLKNLNDGEVKIIGHAGLGFSSLVPFNYLPSNSYASLSEALIEYKVDGVEVDIHMTKDRKFVLYHDTRLDSKTNLKGCIETMNLEELVQAEYKLGFPYDLFQSEQVISFKKLIDLLKEQDEFPLLQLDIRNSSPCFEKEENWTWETEMLRRLIEQLNEWEVPKEKVLFISVAKSLLQEAKAINCPYRLSMEIVEPFEKGLAWALEHEINCITIKPKLLLNKENTAIAHQHGIEVITFGAKSKSGNKKLLELNPDMIQTNNIEALQELLED